MLLVSYHSASAQTPSGGGAEIVVVEHRVDVGSGVERSKGPLFGVAAQWQVAGRWEVGVRTAGGTLRGSSGVMDRKDAEVGLEVRYAAAPWLVVRSTVRRLVYTTDLARQAWTSVALGGEGRLALLGGAATGIVHAAVVPVVAVRGLPSPDAAIAAGAGMEFRRGAALLRVSYGLERFDFPDSNGARHLEQRSALTLGLSLQRRAAGPAAP
jgi:hypothetical protein